MFSIDCPFRRVSNAFCAPRRLDLPVFSDSFVHSFDNKLLFYCVFVYLLCDYSVSLSNEVYESTWSCNMAGLSAIPAVVDIYGSWEADAM